MAARRMASSVYEAHVLEPEDLPKMGCSEGAGDEGHEEAAFCNLLPKSDEEPWGIAFNLPRVRKPNHVFDINFPMAQMIHVACRDHNAACWPVRLLGLSFHKKSCLSFVSVREFVHCAVNNHHMNSNTMTPPHFTHALPVAYLFSCFGFWSGNVLDTRYSQSSCAERKTSGTEMPNQRTSSANMVPKGTVPSPLAYIRG